MRVWQRDLHFGVTRYLYGDIVVSPRDVSVVEKGPWGKGTRRRNKRRWFVTDKSGNLGLRGGYDLLKDAKADAETILDEQRQRAQEKVQ